MPKAGPISQVELFVQCQPSQVFCTPKDGEATITSLLQSSTLLVSIFTQYPVGNFIIKSYTSVLFPAVVLDLSEPALNDLGLVSEQLVTAVWN